MANKSVSAGIFKSFIDYAESKGADREQLLTVSNVSADQLLDQDNRIPFDAYIVMLRESKKLTGDPALLLNHSIDTELDDMSVVGLIVHSSASMPDSMNQLNRYAKLMVEIDIMDGAERFSVEPNELGEVWIIDNRPDPNLTPEITETSFGRFISEFRRSFPDQPFALNMEVSYPAPDYADQYERIYQCGVKFNANRNALQISPYWLTADFEGTSRYVFGIFTEKADKLLEDLQQGDSLRAQIEALLLPSLHKGEMSLDDVAKEMGMSRATLYRRLKDEGVSFAQITDDLRFRMASDYLSARKVSINETAYLVGFSEASSFVRAFRRWTGQTPSEYRDALSSGAIA